MTFRPYPVLTLASALALAGLVWLGFWQLQRAEWKRDLIADYAEQAELPSVSWSEGVCSFLNGARMKSPRSIDPSDVEDHLAAAKPSQPFRVFGRSVDGVVGWRLFVALDASSCGSGAGWILAQTGFEPEMIAGMPPPSPSSEARYRVTPWPDRPPMAGTNAPESNQWYWLDYDRLAAMIGEPLNREYILAPFAGTPDFLTRTPPVRHISYAVTWFGLAICLLIVYVLVHTQTGRLSLGLQKRPDA